MNKEQFESGTYCTPCDVVKLPLAQINRPTIQGGQQVRVGAENSKHIENLAASMKQIGQTVPITVEKRVDGTYDLVAGAHRYSALLQNKETTAKAVVLSFATAKAKFLFQVEENEADVKQNNSYDTRVKILSDLINIHKHFHVNGKFPTMEQVYEQTMDENIFRGGLHSKTLTAMLKGIYKGKKQALQGNYQSYAKESTGLEAVKELYVDSSGEPIWNGESISEVDNGVSIFMVGNSKNAGSAVENALFAKLKNPQIKTVAFCWVDNTFRKSEQTFNTHRRGEYARIKKANNAPFLKKGFNFIDEMWFLPQKASESNKKLYSPTQLKLDKSPTRAVARRGKKAKS